MKNFSTLFAMLVLSLSWPQNSCCAGTIKETELSLSYEEGKNRLLKECLSVIAEYYNVNLAEAQVQAARTWGNPLFVWNADMYSHEWNEYFQMGNQTLVQVEYVLTVSGERVHTIRQANLGVEIARLAFLDVVRGLVMEYSESYTNLSLLLEKSKVYQSILDRYETLIASYEKRLDLNVTAYNDVLRLRSEFISINTEAIQNKNEILAEQNTLNTLLNLPPSTVIITKDREITGGDTLTAGSAIELAKIYRPDYQIAQKNISYYQQALRVQKAQAMPSMNLGYQPRDKGSNYVRPYAGLVIEVGLPIFDRNQAGIQAAKIEIEQSKTELQIFEIGLENDVFTAYLQYMNNKENMANYSVEFMSDLDTLSSEAMKNFNSQTQNLTFLQFMDYQQTFIDAQMQYLELKSVYLNSINQLNFVIGKDITY